MLTLWFQVQIYWYDNIWEYSSSRLLWLLMAWCQMAPGHQLLQYSSSLKNVFIKGMISIPYRWLADHLISCLWDTCNVLLTHCGPGDDLQLYRFDLWDLKEHIWMRFDCLHLDLHYGSSQKSVGKTCFKMVGIMSMSLLVNSLWSGDSIWWHSSGSSLA